MNEIREILKGYMGKLKETNDSSYQEIQIINTNTLQLNNPNIKQKYKKADCYIIVQYYPGPKKYHLWAYESTYEIIGGQSATYDTKEILVDRLYSCLSRYQFIKKERNNEQLSLF